MKVAIKASESKTKRSGLRRALDKKGWKRARSPPSRQQYQTNANMALQLLNFRSWTLPFIGTSTSVDKKVTYPYRILSMHHEFAPNEVSVLWLKEAVGEPLHWSIFVKHLGKPGTKHDIHYYPTSSTTGEWKYDRNQYEEQHCLRLGGKVLEAFITDRDVKHFQTIMEKVSEFPIWNSQKWVYDVIECAVRRGIMRPIALLKLDVVPRVGSGL